MRRSTHIVVGRRVTTGRARCLACAALGLASALSGCAAPRSTDDAAPQRFIEAPTVAENARERFGDRAQQAYRELAQFAIDEWLKAPLVDPGAPTPSAAALSDGIVQHLDPATVPHWHNSVAAALRGDADEASTVRMLRFFNLQAPTLRMPDGGKSPISGEGVTEGNVGLGAVRADGIYPLVVSFQQRARLDLMSGKSPSAVNLRKKVTLTVVPLDELAKATPGATVSTLALLPTSPPSPGSTSLATAPAATATTAPSTGATTTPAPDTPTTVPIVTRDPRIKWLITTFQGDISAGDSSDTADSEDERTTPGTSSGSPAPTSSRNMAR